MFGKRKRTTVGLDIGASAIKVIEIERRGEVIHLVNFGMALLEPETIVDGEIMDRQVVIETIQNLFESRGIKRKRVIAGIHGRGVIVKKIVMEHLEEEHASEAIYWEAEQHIPYDINDVSLDFEILPVDMGPKQMQVLLVAAKRDLILGLADIIREAGLIPDAVDVNSFAVQNVVEMAHDLRPDEVAALLDIGAEITNVNIVRDGIPLYTQDVSLGVNNMVRAVQKRTQVGREEAVRALESMDEKLDVRPLIESFCRDLTHGLDKAATYLKTSGDAEQLDRIFLSGGGGRLKGVVEILSAIQPLPVEVVDPLRRVEYDAEIFAGYDPLEVAPQLAVGVGLALRKAA
ncbi:MAG: type IV pilus assembly protein PilM [Candidatus Eisenbacteria sp.]|nr:type IV pilus assembly protein PilM [Candidatus Eisenbacteria bacterium]